MRLISKIFGTKSTARGVDLQTIYYSDTSAVTNKDLLDLYLNEPIVRSNIDFLIDEILNDKIVSNKQVINEILRRWDLNLNNITKELLIFGYSIQFINREAKRLESIRMSNVMGIKHDEQGNPISFRYAGKDVKIDENYILISLPNPDILISNKASWLYPLLVSHTISINGISYSYNIYDLYKINMYYMLKSFKDNISSKNIIVLDDNADINEIYDSLNDAKTRDSILISGIKDIKILKGNSDSSALALLEKAQELLTLVSNNSFNFLILKQNFTEASAKVTKEIIEKRLQSVKNSILSHVKIILERLGASNFDLEFIDTKVFTFEQIQELVKNRIITPNEARKLLGLNLEDG